MRNSGLDAPENLHAMSEMKRFEQIEDYLLGRLSPEARQTFEAEMAADPALREEVSLHYDMMKAIEEQEEPDIDEPPAKDIIDLREIMGNAYQAFQAEKTDTGPADPSELSSGSSPSPISVPASKGESA